MREVNDAFLKKLAQEACCDKDKLWVRVLRGKYKCGDGMPSFHTNSKNITRCQRGISSVWESFRNSMSWNVGDGNHILFQTYWWADEAGVLKDNAIRPLQSSYTQKDFISAYPCGWIVESPLPSRNVTEPHQQSHHGQSSSFFFPWEDEFDEMGRDGIWKFQCFLCSCQLLSPCDGKQQQIISPSLGLART